MTFQKNKGAFGKTSKALGTEFTNLFFERDESADPVFDNKGQVVPDTSLNDTESIPYGMSVEE